MSWFPRPSSPRAALRDLAEFIRHREREHVIGAALAFLVTLIIVIEFVVDAQIGTKPPPQVVDVELYSSNRTDAEIIADQKKKTWPKSSPPKKKATAIPEAREPVRDVAPGRAALDRRFMDEALRLGQQARGRSAPNPNVGCVIVSAVGRIVGRGATAAGGRPHAEALALEQAGKRAKGATVYELSSPARTRSPRGPACTDLLIAAKPARVVIALKDPDPRTAGKGHSPPPCGRESKWRWASGAKRPSVRSTAG